MIENVFCSLTYKGPFAELNIFHAFWKLGRIFFEIEEREGGERAVFKRILHNNLFKLAPFMKFAKSFNNFCKTVCCLIFFPALICLRERFGLYC